MATDNFNRANETPLAAPWVTGTGALGELGIVSNQVELVTTPNDGGAYYAGAASSGDQYSQCTIAAIAGGEGGPAVRWSATEGDGYVVDSYENGAQIDAVVLRFDDMGGSMSPTAVGATFSAIGPAVGAVMRLEISGTTLTVYRNGISLGTRSDSTYTTGQPGLFAFGSPGKFDDWSGADLAVLTWDQEGYWWRNDNGSETTATYIGAQDTPL